MKNIQCKKLIEPICRKFLSPTITSKCAFGSKGQLLIENLCKKPGPNIPTPAPNINYLLNKINYQNVIENLSKRTEITKEEASKLVDDLYKTKEELQAAPSEKNRQRLNEIASKFPNLTHPQASELSEPKVIKENQWEPKSPLRVIHPFEKLGAMTGGLRTHDTSQVASERSYYLFGQFAELEQALVR